MDGRRIGALLLVVVAVAGVVVHGVTARSVTGTPVATVVPGAPVVGACVVSLSPAPNGRGNTRVDYPYATFGRCDGPIVGEVMAVDPTDHDLARTTVSQYREASSLCELPEVTYVGSIGPFDPASLATPGIGIGWISQVTSSRCRSGRRRCSGQQASSGPPASVPPGTGPPTPARSPPR